VIRDNFGPEFERCIVDDEDLYHQVRGYLAEVAPELLDKVELYGQPTRTRRPERPARRRSIPSTTGTARAPTVRRPARTTPPTRAPPTRAPPTRPPPTRAPPTRTRRPAPSAPVTPTPARCGRRRDPGRQGRPGRHRRPHDDDALTDDDALADDDEEPASPGGGLTAPQLAAARERQQELPPLFDAYDVADQLRKAMGKKVWLPSGGYLIIETTEAMKVIDVNTGKFTGGKDTNLEEVVLKTNLEAADEIVRQLRLRDMGGIIIIDFIDMLLKANQEQVVRRLKRELLRDRTKTGCRRCRVSAWSR
jgi:Ribonuclease G/E